jgi:hypothetical protein
MSIVQELKAQIRETNERIETIQSECSHPSSCVTKIADSDTGNWDKRDDSYWYDCRCDLCDKIWMEDQ